MARGREGGGGDTVTENVNADGRADPLAELRRMAAAGERMLSINLAYATFGVVLRRRPYTEKHAAKVGRATGWFVAEAAPIARWMVGKSEGSVRYWVGRKGGTVTEINGT